jgi:uncharacterized membrane protein YbhN (UPF0104 family)
MANEMSDFVRLHRLPGFAIGYDAEMSLIARTGTVCRHLRWDRWAWALKLALSVGILTWVIETTGVSLSDLRVPQSGALLLAAVVFVVQPIVDIPRWLIILRMLGYRIATNLVFSYFYVGLFFNQILPSSVSGDAVRVFYLRTHAVPWLQNIFSLVLDRLIALGGLALLYVSLFGWASHSLTEHFDARGVRYALFFAIILAGITIAVAHGLRAPAGPPPAPAVTPTERLRAFVRAATGQAGFRWQTTIMLVALGMAVHLMGAIGFSLILRSFGYTLNFIDVFMISALVVIAQSLPISLGGWGAREFAAVALLQRVGVEANDAFFASVLLGLMSLLGALPGIPLWLRLRSGDKNGPDGAPKYQTKPSS